jgi:ABC-type Mn2+/Zn2+ transport system permease subunit
MTLLDFFTDPFALGFQQRALLGGLLAGITCSVVGTWIVLRGMSFFGDAFVHGVIPGIALAVALDFSVLLGAAAAATIMVAGIEWVHRQASFKEDTGIGLLFVGMLALGVLILSRTESYAGSLTTILFGDVLGVSRPDLLVQGLLAAVVVPVSLLLYRPLLALSFDSAKAESLGMAPRATHLALLALIAASVIGSYQAVGTMLVFGLLVGPPAMAALLARSVPGMMVLSLVIATVSVVGGLVISYHVGTAGSATMAVLPIVLFFLTLGVVSTRRAMLDRRLARAATSPVSRAL